MTLNVNGTAMNLVYANGTRMEIVRVNDTEVYRAQNGGVSMVYTGVPNGNFNPGAEDLHRHFVVVGVRFSGDGLFQPTTPTINGTPMTLITRGSSGVADDGGITGIYTIKIPTGTGTFTVAQGGTAFTYIALYRVTGIFAMTTALAAGTNSGAIGGSVASSANGCFFGASVSNFATPPFPSPNSAGLLYDVASQGRMAASNTTTGPTQAISLGGNQINSYATFGYNLY